MCRIAAYAGPPRPLSILLYEPPHSLERQSYQPAAMVRGTVNVDGTGICWWTTEAPEPLRYVTAAPPWSDPNLPSLAGRLRGHMQLATVRSATPGTPHGVAAALPFVDGRIATTLNGFVERFSETLARPLAATLSDAAYARYDVASDALLLHLLVADRLRGSGAGPLAEAVEDVVLHVIDLARSAGIEASLNLVAADGVSIAAVRCAHGVASNGLHLLERSDRWPGSGLLASEPLDDDPGWQEVPDRSVACWRSGAWDISELDLSGRRR